MPPDPVNRWTIYVCEACGAYGWVFGSEYSIPLACPEPGEDHPDGRHRGPYRKVEVIPASSAASEADPALGFSVEEIEALLSNGGVFSSSDKSELQSPHSVLLSACGKLQRSLKARRDD